MRIPMRIPRTYGAIRCHDDRNRATGAEMSYVDLHTSVQGLTRTVIGPRFSEAIALIPNCSGKCYFQLLQFPILRHIETTPQTSLHTGELVTRATTPCIPNTT